jgi:hypothetical protein
VGHLCYCAHDPPLFAIAKMGQILFIFGARDHTTFLIKPVAVFSGSTRFQSERRFTRRTWHNIQTAQFCVVMDVPRAVEENLGDNMRTTNCASAWLGSSESLSSALAILCRRNLCCLSKSMNSMPT